MPANKACGTPAASAGDRVEMELQDMFWGGYFGSCKDQFGVQWMFNCTAQ